MAFTALLRRLKLPISGTQLRSYSCYKSLKPAPFALTRWNGMQLGVYNLSRRPEFITRVAGEVYGPFLTAHRIHSEAASDNLVELNLEDPRDFELAFLGVAPKGHFWVLEKFMEEYRNGEGPGEYLYAKMKTPLGFTALHLAALEGHTDFCKFLIEKLEFDINEADSRGNSALFLSIREGQWPTAIFLIDNGADVTKRNTLGETPLHYAAMKGSKEIAKLLLSKGSDLNAISAMGMPLHYAARYGHHEVLKYFLDLKADPNLITPSLDLSPLQCALRARSKECMKLLLEAGANPNQPCCLVTPLSIAVRYLDEDTIKCLLKAGADPNMRDSVVGHTPLEQAARIGRQDVVELLFPITNPVPCFPDWSICGVMQYAKSEEAETLNEPKIEKFVPLAKAKGDEALMRNNYFDAIEWYYLPCEFDDIEALLNRSFCNAKLFCSEEALADAQKCIELEPDCVMAHYRMGEAWNVSCDFKKAAEAYSRAFALDPDNKEIEEAFMAALAEHYKFKHWDKVKNVVQVEVGMR